MSYLLLYVHLIIVLFIIICAPNMLRQIVIHYISTDSSFYFNDILKNYICFPLRSSCRAYALPCTIIQSNLSKITATICDSQMTSLQ